ncbi:MAG: UDP-N-acetylmuramate dehydrogenase [Acidobacteriota bacterium]|nr:UDP-N-acetylmuramate dehydrogenase [Acidobacteriota bacterium]
MSTLKVGGIAEWFTQVNQLQQLQQAQAWAKQEGLPIFYLGDGSNVLFPDGSWPGLVIQNGIKGRQQKSSTEVQLCGGENLQNIVCWLNDLGLAGMECLYGIPGTLAGALVGNAGAYGQQLSDAVVEVSFWSGDQIEVLSSSELDFGYRHSIFKTHREWFILNCQMRLTESIEPLQDVSGEILSRRLKKYPVGLKCPGSFFKNISIHQVPQKILEKIPEDLIMFDKIPAGKLLEAVGANGMRRGDAQFASYHGNLIINLDKATSQDILLLAREYAEQVWNRFSIRLEPEIFIFE